MARNRKWQTLRQTWQESKRDKFVRYYFRLQMVQNYCTMYILPAKVAMASAAISLNWRCFHNNS